MQHASSTPSPDASSSPPTLIQVSSNEWNEMKRALTHLLDKQKQVASQAAVPRLALPKIPTPSQFHGETGFRCDDWIRELERQFDYYDVDFATDAARIKFATAFMDGHAIQWWTTRMPELQQEVASQGRPLTWAVFVDELRDRFRPILGSEVARTVLDHLQQGSLSVDDYAARFRAVLTPVTNMDEADKVHRFITNMRNGLKQRVLQKGPKTLDEAIKVAASEEHVYKYSKPLSAESAMRYAMGKRNDAASSVPMDINNMESRDSDEAQASGSIASSADSSLDSLATKLMERVDQRINAVMQRNNQRRSNDRVSGLTREDVERCLRTGLCFFCKEHGHMKRDCPKRNAQPAPKSGK